MPELARDTLIDGRYRVVSRLGTGGMADVFLCRDEQLGRQVAVKLLHRRFAEDPAFVERFRLEARAAAGLQHPNIVSVYDRGEWDGTYYIAMEYLPGHTLKEIIVAEAPLDPVRAIDIAIGILRAARFAHRQGIVHRDLKPHNVIVDDAGTAKVTDFGIARAGASDMTETGSIMGTAQYLSPEQAQGHSVSASSDLYSIGVVLYEMVTGRVPFDGEQAVTIALKHVSEAPVPPRQINPAVPPELEQTILWTLNKSPADRPADADQLITVLQHCRQAIVAGAAGQHTASMAAVAAGAAAGLPVENLPEPPVFLGPERDTGSGEMAAVAPEEEARGRRRAWLWGLVVLILVLAAAAAAYFIFRPHKRVVPNVVGRSLSVATTVLQNDGFTLASPTRVPSSRPAQTVIRESPPGGASADKGATVTLFYSAGPGNVPVPSVQGEKKAQATKALQGAGLKVTRTIPQSSSRFAAGEATGTSPGAGQSLPRGTGVTLLISSGAPTATVPPVVGETQAEASSKLAAAGFKVSVTRSTTSATTAGTVVAGGESPAGNTAGVRLGSTVTITVAVAPAQQAVPSVTGDPTASAESALQGFAIVHRYRTVSDPARVGTVLAQSPGEGVRVDAGASVTITIGVAASSSSTSSSTTSSSTTTSSSSTPSLGSVTSTAP